MRLLLCFVIAVAFFSCQDHSNNPDVSHIEMKLLTKRFEKDLFSLDQSDIAVKLDTLIAQYPDFGENFMLNILNADPKWSNDTIANYVNGFVQAYRSLYDTTQLIFKDFSVYENEIKKSMQLFRHYFPNDSNYKLPTEIITYIGPLDGYGDVLTENAFVVGLQHHLGKNATYYQSEWFNETYPAYISNRFEPSYIAINCIKNLLSDRYPESSENQSLSIQMIEKGKRLYLLQQLLPSKKDYQLIGYTEKQMTDCYAHEAAIWNLFIKNDLLQNQDFNFIKNYIGESPKTQELGDASPGNIGAFVGWQIVKKFMKKNTSVSLTELMKTKAETILEKTKYKP